MATPLSASKALAAIKAEGCRVTEHGNWRTHNRGNRGTGWGPVNGVMIHHTVTSGTNNSVALCYNGHSALPGPLCHTVGAKDGRLYMVGWGRANHAGNGDDDVLAAVIAETALPADNEANTDGNSRFYGIELINLGNGKDPWPEAQVDAAARWAAALCRAHGWSAASVIGHKEWQPGKIDPTFSMGAFRTRVGKLLAANPGTNTPAPKPEAPQQEDDMPHYLSIGTDTPMTVTPGAWDAIEFTEEWSDPGHDHWDKGGSQFVDGPALFNGQVGVRVHGLPAGAEFQVMLSEVNAKGEYVKDHDISELVGTSGDTYQVVPLTGSVPSGRGARVRVKHWHTGGPVRIEAYVKALIWDR